MLVSKGTAVRCLHTYTKHIHTYTKHGPPPLWTRSMDPFMDPFMDPVHGLPLWTIPHFVLLKAERSLREREKETSDPRTYLSGQFQQLSLIDI